MRKTGVYAEGGGKGGVWRGPGGFTFVEVAVVVAAVAALSVFAAGVVWSAMTNYRFNAATAKVLQDIRYAQQQARVRNGWYGIQFQTPGTYHVYQTDGSTDTDVTDPANRAATLVVDTSNSYGVSISAVNIDGGDKVEFGPVGTPYVDKAGAALASAGTVTLTAGGSSRVIQVLKGTGRAELQ